MKAKSYRRTSATPVLSLVVPCYNEAQVIEETCERLLSVLVHLINSDVIDTKSFIVFIDDGSTDETWELIVESSESSEFVRGLKLSRNFGHQNALLAGLMHTKGRADISISIDADLQQDELVMERFIEKYRDGYDIVYGVREDRKADGPLKRWTAKFFYRAMKLMGVDIIADHADYRLVSNRVLTTLSDYEEVNIFLRGIFPSMGYRTAMVTHKVKPRPAGHSKYSVGRMVSFAFDGITSFSIVPIRLVTVLGFAIFGLSFLMATYVLFVAMSGRGIVGWASTVLPIYGIGGTILLGLGLIGEYVGKIYKEVKRRPRFIIEEEV